MTAAAVKVAIAEAKPATIEAPRPLSRPLPPGKPFPVEDLGSLLSGAATAIHDKVQAPMAICAQSVLGVASLAVQGHVDVALPTGQSRPTSLYLVTVAASGERKSSVDGEALRPVRQREEALRAEHEHSKPIHNDALEAWEAARARAKKVVGPKSMDPAAIQTALARIGPKPLAPLVPMLTATEPTLEGLYKLYEAGHPALGLFTAEGGQFIGGHAMSDDAKLRSASGLSTLWDGEPLRRVRAGDGATLLSGRRLAAHVMAQPDATMVLLRDAVLVDQGFVSRLLSVAPESAAGTRLWHEPNPTSDCILTNYNDRIRDLLARPYSLIAGTRNQLAPRKLPLSVEARAMFIGFADHVERSIGADGVLAPVRGLANKLPEHAARIGGVLTLIHDPAAGEIRAEEMASGITLARYYADEGLRLQQAGKLSPKTLAAQQLLNWLLNGWRDPFVSSVEIVQRGPYAIRETEVAKPLVKLLEEHGWLRRVDGGATVAGHRRREAWFIVREA